MFNGGRTSYGAIVGMLLVAALLYPSAIHADRFSPLSAWLSKDVLVEVVDLLSRHPRFAGQPVGATSAAGDGLSSAIIIIVNSHLDAREEITRVAQSRTSGATASVPTSIDDIECGTGEAPAVGLQVSVKSLSGNRGRVVLALFDSGDPTRYWRRWEWEGSFSRAERKALSDTTSARTADGSLRYPWPETAIEQAALSLTGDMACDLRLQVRDRINLQWNEAHLMPGQLGDVSNASRHLLGNFREVGLAGTDADFEVVVRAEPLRDNIWQIWLTGAPGSSEFHPVQAVTYMQLAGTATPFSNVSRRQVAAASVSRIRPDDPALQYLDVQVLDVVQADRRLAKAELKVELKLTNRAQHPIHYAFALSGGHYLHCAPRPELYRHDRYGYLEGELQPGQSTVRRMVVEDVQHNPNPWFGPRKCAGLRDLEGFEEFAGKGYKVTEFVRWSG